MPTLEDPAARASCAGALLAKRFEALLARYSARESVASIAADARCLLSRDLPALVAAHRPTSPGYETLLRFAAMLVLSRPSPPEGAAFAAAIEDWAGDRGTDKLLGTFLAALDPWRAVDTDSRQLLRPETYGSLWEAMSRRREATLLRFVSEWSAAGDWCLEAAAGALLAGLDDLPLPRYPLDLAAFARSSCKETREVRIDDYPENTLVVETTQGSVVIELRPDLAPEHVARIKALARDGAYDGVVFQSVIGGFAVSTGDVNLGNGSGKDLDLRRVGKGGSSRTDLAQELSADAHVRGVVSMSRASHPDGADSQFLVVLHDSPFLDEKYAVCGRVIEGMETFDRLRRGKRVKNRAKNPGRMTSVRVAADLASRPRP